MIGSPSRCPVCLRSSPVEGGGLALPSGGSGGGCAALAVGAGRGARGLCCGHRESGGWAVNASLSLNAALAALDKARSLVAGHTKLLQVAREAGREDARAELVALLRCDADSEKNCVGEALSEGSPASAHAHASYVLGLIADQLEDAGLELQQALAWVRKRKAPATPASAVEAAYLAGRADQREEQGETPPADVLVERARVLALIDEDLHDFRDYEDKAELRQYLRALRFAVVKGTPAKRES